MREYTKVIHVSQFRTARIGDVFIMKDGRVFTSWGRLF